MNAAARLVHQNTLTRHMVLTHLLNRWQVVVLMIGLAVVMSALSIIYVTQSQRILNADYQRSLALHDQLQIEHGQLLLEHSAQLMQAEVQQTAEKKLQMSVPDHHSLVVVSE